MLESLMHRPLIPPAPRQVSRLPPAFSLPGIGLMECPCICPWFLGGPTWPRTRDLPVMSRWLYQLSYGPNLLPSTTPHYKETPETLSSAFPKVQHGPRFAHPVRMAGRAVGTVRSHLASPNHLDFLPGCCREAMRSLRALSISASPRFSSAARSSSSMAASGRCVSW